MTVLIKRRSVPSINWDVIVIGSGAAGLMTALELPDHLNILLLNRNTSKRSASRWAQGGIAAVTSNQDNIYCHAQDTLKAGDGICDADAVELFVKNAPKCVERLQNLGMDFDQIDGKLSTTLEAAHSHRRVLHVQDRTGRALVDVLQERVEESQNIYHYRGIRVTKLLVENNHCCGVQVLDGLFLYWIKARGVVLASGGGGHLFANTTNPAQASGEGIALAWQAGASIEDLEFVQFHPTALKLNHAPCFLLTEALRGEGAVLVDKYGESAVKKLLGKDLAPRDQVSRALLQIMSEQDIDNVWLNLKPIGAAKIETRFPNILKRCRDFGLDPIKELIPVAPAAHYWMGGVATNLFAETDLPGLFAVGEVACTGLHGANRLASNSLMECVVFAGQLSKIQLNTKEIEKNCFDNKNIESCPYFLSDNFSSKDLKIKIDNLRVLMWREAGVDRSYFGLNKALKIIQKEMQISSGEPLIEFIHTNNIGSIYELSEKQRSDLNLLLDLYHRQITSSLMLKACLFRSESRGGHFRKDFKKSSPYWHCHSQQKIGNEISTRPVNN